MVLKNSASHWDGRFYGEKTKSATQKEKSAWTQRQRQKKDVEQVKVERQRIKETRRKGNWGEKV